MLKSSREGAGVVRRKFPAMGTTVQLVAPGESDARSVSRAERVVRLIFSREESRFSRFRKDSELSRVNAAAGRWIRVSKPFDSLLKRAIRAALDTEGLFDPTVLPALRAAGYDRDFREVLARDEEATDADLAEIRREFRDLMVKDATACGAWREIELNGDRVRLPEGSELDFGGIAKGWTVDAAISSVPPLPWAIVDAGGDLRVAGHPPGEGFDIAVEDPERSNEEALRIRLMSGAVATSSTKVRSWGAGSHHIIDPRTSLPALTQVVQATVWAESCADAEVWSKAALLAGPPILDRVDGSLVLSTGEVVTNFAADSPGSLGGAVA